MRKKKLPPHWDQIERAFRRDDYYCSECGYQSKRPTRFCGGCGERLYGAYKKYDFEEELNWDELLFDE